MAFHPTIRTHLMSCSYERQAHSDGRPFARFRRNTNFSAMRRDNPLGDAQAKPAAFNHVAVRGIAAIEPVKHPRQKFRRDAFAGIGDADLRHAVHSLKFHRHAPLWTIVFDGVVGEVQKQLAQAMAVAAHPR